MAFVGVMLGGAGHGWMEGSAGCLLLAPAFFATANALCAIPSRAFAVGTLVAGLIICGGIGLATFSSESLGFSRAWGRTPLAWKIFYLPISFSWAVTSMWALVRIQTATRLEPNRD